MTVTLCERLILNSECTYEIDSKDTKYCINGALASRLKDIAALHRMIDNMIITSSAQLC